MAFLSRFVGLGTIIFLCVGFTVPLAQATSDTQIRLVQSSNVQNRTLEAAQFLQEGKQQLDSGQFEAAISSFKKALAIFEDISLYKGIMGARLGMVLAYFRLEEIDSAVKILEETLKFAQDNNDVESKEKLLQILQTVQDYTNDAYSLLGRAAGQYREGKYNASLEYLQQALKLYQQAGNQNGEAVTLNGLGASYFALNRYEIAVKIYQQALQVSREIENNYEEATALHNLGLVYSRLGKYQKAIEFYQESLGIFQKMSNREGAANSLDGLGSTYFRLGEYQKATDFLQQSLAINREIGDREGEASSLNNLGLVHSSLGEYQKAIEFHQKSLAIDREIGNREEEATSLSNLGGVYSSLGQYQKAIEFLQQALAIAQEIGDRKGEATSLGILGEAHGGLGEYRKAIDFLQQSLAINREIGNRREEAISLGGLGNAYNSLAQYQKAIEFYQQSLAIIRETGEHPKEATILSNLGGVYSSLGEYQKAIDFLQQSLAIAQEIGNRNEEATSLGNLGNTYNSLAQYQKAIEFYQQSLAIIRETGERPKEAKILSNLGSVYSSLGQYQKAIDFLQQSLAIAQEIGDLDGEASALGNLGNTYNSLAQYQKAIEFYQQSLAIAQETGNLDGEATGLGNLGSIYLRLGQYQKVIESYQQSLAINREIGNRQGEATFLSGLGNAYIILGQYQRAIDFYQQSLAIAREIGNRQIEANSLNNLGATYNKSGEFLKAEEILLSGTNIFESIRQDSGDDTNKVSIFDTQTTPYKTLQTVLIAQNKINLALEIAERSRAKGLVDLLTARLSDSPEDLKVNPLNIQQIRQVAKDKQATLVLYSVLEDEIFTWVIKPTGEVEFQRQDYESDLNELVEVARDSIGVRDRGVIKLVPISESDETQQREKLQQLYQLLIEPIADFLPKNPDEPVIFMPQGALFLVPFPALQDAEGNYLVDKHTILTAPSIQTLQLTRQQRQRVSGEGVLIVGNPTMPSVPKEIGEEPRQLDPLEGAETEAKAIAEFFNTDAMIGSQATKSAVLEKIANARVVHLATHGLLDDFGLGVPGAIALAPDPNFKPEIGEFNGLLTAGEIFDLDLSAELVVLSACNTGRGHIRGEGVIGLSRSLIQAGVPSVLVSLWQVPDAPTAELMVEFYRNLEEKNLDKAQALRQAMLTIKEKHPNPRNWAAFTLIGEAD